MSAPGVSLLGNFNVPQIMPGGGMPMPMGGPVAAPQQAPAPVQQPAPQMAPTGRPLPKPGDIVNYHRFVGGNPADPNAWEPVHGHDFLHELGKADPTMAIRVQAILDGREPFPSQSRKNPLNTSLINAVAQADPDNYDAINHNVRAKTRAEFAANGASALNIRNLNQAIGHLQAMVDEYPNVAGHGGKGSIPGMLGIATPINSVENTYAQYSGDQGITNYNVAKTALAGELAALFKGKGASAESEVNTWKDLLDAGNSNEQKLGEARKISELLKSRLDELNQQYKQGMGTTATPFEALNPLAADAYKRLSIIGKAITPAPSNSAGDDLVAKYRSRK